MAIVRAKRIQMTNAIVPQRYSKSNQKVLATSASLSAAVDIPEVKTKHASTMLNTLKDNEID